ncbi:MAG: MFS transporter [Oscillospiraceae bacterium]|nr:MFS transporter [Oscillospiraceae bacterium]
MEHSAPQKLWTRDFTIITLGSLVSMMGNSMSGFALSLLVLDYTGSTLLYAVYTVAFTAPSFIMPLFSGAILDRFSRKKTIYTLDFTSAGIYLLAALLLRSGAFNFAWLAAGCFVVGTVNSVYWIAYESFYPMLITPGNYSKAYSIGSVLETLSAVMVPVSTWLYKLVGISPLLAGNSLFFLAAAITETRIGFQEPYLENRKGEKLTFRGLFGDIGDGFRYLRAERGLLLVGAYFFFSCFADGASQVIALPWFRSAFPNGEYIFMLVGAMALMGRALGGGLNYRFTLPARSRWAVALGVYCIINLLFGTYLYMPLPVMLLFNFLSGLLGVTSYTIRVSATSAYVPDERKGRFNGAFAMLNTGGMLAGELLAGLLTEVFPQRAVHASFYALTFLAALILIGGGRRSVSAIYNNVQ